MKTYKKILVIDDYKGILDALEVIISDMGHTVFLSKNVSQAKKIIANEPIDLILCDLVMMKETALDFLKWNNENNKIPTLVMTGLFDIALRPKIKKLGAIGLLIKPFDVHELEAQISAIFNNRADKIAA
jgi:DNA-binding NtrC family response regulator